MRSKSPFMNIIAIVYRTCKDYNILYIDRSFFPFFFLHYTAVSIVYYPYYARVWCVRTYTYIFDRTRLVTWLVFHNDVQRRYDVYTRGRRLPHTAPGHDIIISEPDAGVINHLFRGALYAENARCFWGCLYYYR